MAVYGGVGEHLAQGVEQQQQAAALFRRARVLGESSVGCEASGYLWNLWEILFFKELTITNKTKENAQN